MIKYGIYQKSHTMESLSSELSNTFEVQKCFEERDPRYIVVVVKRRKHDGHFVSRKNNTSNQIQKYDVSGDEINSAKVLISKIEKFVKYL